MIQSAWLSICFIPSEICVLEDRTHEPALSWMLWRQRLFVLTLWYQRLLWWAVLLVVSVAAHKMLEWNENIAQRCTQTHLRKEYLETQSYSA